MCTDGDRQTERERKKEFTSPQDEEVPVMQYVV